MAFVSLPFIRVIIFVTFPLLIAGQCNYDQKCWFASVGCTLARGNPFERRAYITCDECLELCLARKNGPAPYCCKSVVYDTQWKYCDLFAIQAQKQGDFVKYPGRVYLSPLGNCSASATTAAASASPASAGPSSAPATTAAPITDCPPDQKAVLSIFQNATNPAMASGGTPINAATSDSCGLLCVQNKDDKGNPFACKMASFSQGKCIFSNQAPGPNTAQTLQPATDPNALYLEKKCYPKDQTGTCTAIVLDPHHLIVGYNRQTVSAASYDQCLQQCLGAMQKFGFTCNSGQYYADVTTDNCILNVETRETKPDLYLATDDNNIYFEPQCAAGKRLIYSMKRRAKARFSLRDVAFDDKAEIRWSDWSECDNKTHTKRRYKNCRSLRPTECEKQVVPCEQPGIEFLVKEYAKSLIPCKPIIKGGKVDCTRGLRVDPVKGTREYDCIPNTRECLIPKAIINFS